MRRGNVASGATGFTLIELMIGLALGLAVTAGCATLWAAQLRESRDQLAEARLDQDLRAALDLVGRDLRRAGYWGAAASTAPATPNPYAALTTSAGATDSVSFRYSLDAIENGVVDSNEQFGFRVRDGVLQSQLGDANWQPMTDASAMTVTGFRVAPTSRSIPLGAYCTRPCEAGAGDCPPRLTVRGLAVTLQARLPTGAGLPPIERSATEQIRLRNDRIDGRCTP